MIGTIKSMHELGVYHDSLHDKDAYVVDSSGALKLIMIVGSFGSHQHRTVESYKVEQLKDFKSVLKSSFLKTYLSDSQKEERNKFLSLFDKHNQHPLYLTYDELVKKLSTHPFLLDPNVHEGIKQKKIHEFAILRSQLLDSASCFGKYANLTQGIPTDGAVRRIFNYRNTYYHHDALDLIRFLRNLSHDVPDEEIQHIDRRISYGLAN